MRGITYKKEGQAKPKKQVTTVPLLCAFTHKPFSTNSTALCSQLISCCIVSFYNALLLKDFYPQHAGNHFTCFFANFVDPGFYCKKNIQSNSNYMIFHFYMPKGSCYVMAPDVCLSVHLSVSNILWTQLLQFPSNFHETYTGFLPYDVVVHEGWILRFNISVQSYGPFYISYIEILSGVYCNALQCSCLKE